MELNTINKTGTWSETADRINSNFSKISIEVEEIKQNGGGGSGGGGGDVTNADHATSAYTLDKNTPVLPKLRVAGSSPVCRSAEYQALI